MNICVKHYYSDTMVIRNHLPHNVIRKSTIREKKRTYSNQRKKTLRHTHTHEQIQTHIWTQSYKHTIYKNLYTQHTQTLTQ